MSYRWSHGAPRRGVAIAALLAATTFLTVAGGLIAVGPAQASTLPTLTLTLTKSSITVGGSTQSGGVNVVTTATGVKEAAAILFLLKPGVSFEEVENAKKSSGSAGKDPNFTSKYGSIVFSAEASPGHTREAQTYLQPGQYVAVIPGEGRSKAHATFTVTAAASPAALPTPQATIRSIEFGFRGPSILKDGELVRFENEGFLVHMDIAFPAKSQSAAKQIVKDLLAGKRKGARKVRRRRTGELRGTDVPRSLRAGDDYRKAGLVCAGVLHGNPGRT